MNLPDHPLRVEAVRRALADYDRTSVLIRTSTEQADRDAHQRACADLSRLTVGMARLILQMAVDPY